MIPKNVWNEWKKGEYIEWEEKKWNFLMDGDVVVFNTINIEWDIFSIEK
jgi:hypothetical protein